MNVRIVKGKVMTIENIRKAVLDIISDYSVSRVVLFGSRADGTNKENSDVDLIIEFHAPVSLLTLSQIKCDLEDILGLNVDVIHGPIREGDMIEIGEEVELYAA